MQDHIEKFMSMASRIQRLGYFVERPGPFEMIISSNPAAQVNKSIDLLIVALVHGNEPGGLYAFNNFLQVILETKPHINSKVCLALGNIEAYQQNVRFIDYDMNRLFGVNNSVPRDSTHVPRLQKLINRSKVILDLHQTNEETLSDFFIFPHTNNNVHFASFLDHKIPTIVHGIEFSQDGMTLDIYGTLQGKTAITYEMGTRGNFQGQVLKTMNMILRACDYHKNKVLELNALYSWQQVILNDGETHLVPGLRNFSVVKQGEVFARKGDQDIVAEKEGYVLFPKYDLKNTQITEICRLVSKQENLTPISLATHTSQKESQAQLTHM